MDNWRHKTNISETSFWEVSVPKRNSSDTAAQGLGEFPSVHWFCLAAGRQLAMWLGHQSSLWTATVLSLTWQGNTGHYQMRSPC